MFAVIGYEYQQSVWEDWPHCRWCCCWWLWHSERWHRVAQPPKQIFHFHKMSLVIIFKLWTWLFGGYARKAGGRICWQRVTYCSRLSKKKNTNSSCLVLWPDAMMHTSMGQFLVNQSKLWLWIHGCCCYCCWHFENRLEKRLMS